MNKIDHIVLDELHKLIQEEIGASERGWTQTIARSASKRVAAKVLKEFCADAKRTFYEQDEIKSFWTWIEKAKESWLGDEEGGKNGS